MRMLINHNMSLCKKIREITPLLLIVLCLNRAQDTLLIDIRKITWIALHKLNSLNIRSKIHRQQRRMKIRIV